MGDMDDLLPAGLLRNVALGMPITADLSRSDLLLLRPQTAEQLLVVAQAQPHSIATLYADDLVGRSLTKEDVPVIVEAWHQRRHRRAQRDLPSGASVVQDVYPILAKDGAVAGLLSIETSLIQLERHRQRHHSFRRAIDWLKIMCARGELIVSESLSPFGEWDGVALVDGQRRIAYLSGIANNLFRRLGYMEDLRGRRLSYLNTSDDEIVVAAIEARRPLEREVKEGSHIWVRKVVPIWPPDTAQGMLRRIIGGQRGSDDVAGVLILIHDATEERRKREELQVKTTMIQEVHHRVKNNLQTIAAVLRMQARRATDRNTLVALNEAIARILSVAVIHEFLSLNERQSINVRDICQRIVAQTRQVMVPEQQIDLSVEGPVVYLPSQQATSCALVINELVQNALEHGFEHRKRGRIQMILTDGGDQVQLEVIDDGEPLPDDFDFGSTGSLGLQIVRSLVTGDLRGQVRLENQARGVVATVVFPKVVMPKVVQA